MGVYEKNNRWEYRFQTAGMKVRVSTGLRSRSTAGREINREAALKLEDAHRIGIQEGRLGIYPIVPATFREAAARHIDWLRSEKKASTAKRSIMSLHSADEYFRTTMVSAIDSARVEAYKAHRLSEVAPVTVNHDLCALSGFFDWAKKRRLTMTNPCEDVSKPSLEDARRTRVVTQQEEELYFFAAGESKVGDIARLMVLQGCRPGELKALEQADVDLIAGTMYIRTSKTKAGRRTLRLTGEAKEILARRLDKAGKWVFPHHGGHVEKLGRAHRIALDKAGVEFPLYAFRHTFATRFAAAGGDILQLRDILGHTSVKVTERYMHLGQRSRDAGMAFYEANVLGVEMREKGPVQ